MLGLILGGVYFLYLAFMGGATSTEVAYLQATSFLYSWYWVTSIIVTIIVGVFTLLPLLGFGAVGAVGGGKVGGVLGSVVGGLGGLAAGGLVAALMLVRILVHCAMLIGGAYLMMTAGNASMEFGQFEMWRLGVGAGLILFGILLGKGGNSSSSRSSD